jgi:hypothetical protein
MASAACHRETSHVRVFLVVPAADTTVHLSVCYPYQLVTLFPFESKRVEGSSLKTMSWGSNDI